MDNLVFSRLPDSGPARILQSSRAGIGSSDGRGKTRKEEEILEPHSTRRRDAARWRNESQGVFGCCNFQAVETAKVRSRQAGLAGRFRWRGDAPHLPNQLTNLAERPVAEPPGGLDAVFGLHPSPDGTGTGASAGRHSETALRGRSRERRQALSVLRGPHAGESGVGRKAGPISVYRTARCPSRSRQRIDSACSAAGAAVQRSASQN